MNRPRFVFACLIQFALIACAPSPTATPIPFRTIIPTIAATLSPTATIIPSTSTPIPATATLTLIPPTLTRVVATTIPPISVTVNLSNGATATLTAQGGRTEIALSIKPSTSNVAQLAAIVEGTCARPGILRYALNNSVSGKSTTVINESLESLLSGVLLVIARESEQENSALVACGVIPEAIFVKLGGGKDAGQPGTAVFFAQGARFEADLFIKPGPAGVAQPAFLWLGSCEEPIALRYAFNHVLDGVSKTVFDIPFSVFKKERGAIIVHKSLLELDKHVACGMIAPESEVIDRH